MPDGPAARRATRRGGVDRPLDPDFREADRSRIRTRTPSLARPNARSTASGRNFVRLTRPRAARSPATYEMPPKAARSPSADQPHLLLDRDQAEERAEHPDRSGSAPRTSRTRGRGRRRVRRAAAGCRTPASRVADPTRSTARRGRTRRSRRAGAPSTVTMAAAQERAGEHHLLARVAAAARREEVADRVRPPTAKIATSPSTNLSSRNANAAKNTRKPTAPRRTPIALPASRTLGWCSSSRSRRWRLAVRLDLGRSGSLNGETGRDHEDDRGEQERPVGVEDPLDQRRAGSTPTGAKISLMSASREFARTRSSGSWTTGRDEGAPSRSSSPCRAPGRRRPGGR